MNKIFLPTKYVKDIFSIDYKKLKKKKKQYLLFDLDNTIGSLLEDVPNDKIVKLFTSLKKDFVIVIISNNFKKRVKAFGESLEVDYYYLAMKPLGKVIRKIRHKYNCKNGDMVLIGDQLVTDIFLGNRMKIDTILVDPIHPKEMKITSINRFIEGRILKNYKSKGWLERGKYHA